MFLIGYTMQLPHTFKGDDDFYALPPHFYIAQGFESMLGYTIFQNTWVETVLDTGSSEEDLLSLEIFRVDSRPQC